MGKQTSVVGTHKAVAALSQSQLEFNDTVNLALIKRETSAVTANVTAH